MTCPDPGVYHGVPFDTYAQWSAMNFSSLVHGRKSMKHVRAALAGEIPRPSRPMQLGSLVHDGVLEPDSLFDRYAVMPDYEHDAENVTTGKSPKSTTSKNTLYYRERAAGFRKANPGKVIVTQAELDAMHGMLASLHADPVASSLLGQSGQTEVSVVWDAKIMLAKSRLDMVTDGHIIDLKTTADASTFAFQRSIERFGYHVQAAMYEDAWLDQNGERCLYTIVAMETNPPYAVRCAPMSREAVNVGRELYQQIMRDYQTCIEMEHWMGYEQIEEWGLPKWTMPEEDPIPW